MISMNEVNCKWYEREKSGLIGQAPELIIRYEWGGYNGDRGGLYWVSPFQP